MLDIILEKWWLLTKIAALGAFCGAIIGGAYRVEDWEQEEE